MFKKTLLFLAAMLLLCLPVFAQSEYNARCSTTQCTAGEQVVFELDLPETHGAIKAIINDTETDVELVQNEKGYAVTLTLNRLGRNTIVFCEYRQGAETCRFPRKPLVLYVGLTRVLTERAYVAEHDMACVSAVLPKDLSVKGYGFEYGEKRDDLSHTVAGNSPYQYEYNKLLTDLQAGHTYYYRAYADTAEGRQYGETLSFTTLSKSEWSAEDAIFATAEERYRFLFDDVSRCPTIENPPKGYNGAEEAMKHIVPVKIPVWRVTHGDGREATEMTVYVNRKLANNVQAIFEEIFALDMQFPINFCKGMSYRRINGLEIFEDTTFLSHHSFGTAIDVNYYDNKFYPVGYDGRDKNNPHTIPIEVINVFEKYGWVWGGYYVEGIDSMHFQYLGLDLMTEVDYMAPPTYDIRG